MSPAIWRRYLRFWRNDVDADLDDEFRFHFETEVDGLVARGVQPDVARDDARRRFGDVDLYRRVCRSADERRMGRVRRVEHMSALAHDLRYAIRSLRRQPAFTAIAVATLALGIGANTAIFSVVNGVLFRPLPYRDASRLVTLWETTRAGDRILVSYPNFLDWRKRQKGFDDIAVYNAFTSFNMTGQGDAERVRGALVSGNYFGVLGVRPAAGRLIGPADDSPGAPRIAVLGYGFFQSHFGGDPATLGRTLVLDGDAYTIAGVLPPNVRMPYRDANPEVMLPVAPFTSRPSYDRASHALLGVGRLRPGVSLEQGTADLQRVSAELREMYPGENAGIGSGGAPLMDILVGRIKPALRVLMIAVGAVLLIACANVAGLVLARSVARQREFALRTALGAGRGRILRQVLTESIVLAVAGGVLGIGIAALGVRLLVLAGPGSVPRLAEIQVDSTVLLFALGVSVLTGLLFGLVPTMQGTSRLLEALKEGGRGAGAGASRQRTRALFTVAEVALAVVLLAGAGLLVRSFAKLTAVDPGFAPDHLVIGVIRLREVKYPSDERQRAAITQMLTDVRAIPGVESATIASDLPVTANWQSTVAFESLPEPDPTKLPLLNGSVADPAYFETLRIPVVSGRTFAESDGPRDPRVVVISETIAKRFFADGSPLGQRMTQGQPGDTSTWLTIVGVVKDTRTDGLAREPRGTFYLPRAQEELRGGWLIVRSTLPAERVTTAVRRALAGVDKDMPLANVRTMDAELSQLVDEPRFSMLLLTTFAGVALVLASVGIYGVISYNVTQRAGEIGVRMALGAQRRDVLGLVVGQAMTMTLAGVVIGVLLALWGGTTLSSMLYDVAPRDPVVLGAACAFLFVIAVSAALVPALRAARIDPTIAMRGD